MIKHRRINRLSHEVIHYSDIFFWFDCKDVVANVAISIDNLFIRL